jgi:formylglycine-generating enzyme required for sulfatase activity
MAAPTATGARSGDVFYCPVCGQKHRGDLSSLAGTDKVVRAPCAGCKRPLVIGLRDGAPTVRIATGDGPGVGAGAMGPLDPDRTRETPLPDPSTSTGSLFAGVAAPPAPDEPRKEKDRPKDAERARKEKEPAREPAKSRRAEEPKEKEEASPREPVEGDIPAGTRLGRYVVEEPIGAGGTGTVYRAFDATTNRYVALKMLGLGLSESMRQRFLREIEVQANLRHAHLMPVFDRGEHEGRPYFTMELLYRPFTLTEIVTRARDGTLSRYATLRPFESLEALVRDVVRPACDGIYVANVENGVVHRDLKPDNVLVDSRTLRPYVIDFGICHVLEGRLRTSSTVLAPTAEEAGIVGTPRFLAPEQARGTVHERTDVWGLGAVLHFAISGEPPIAAAAPITRKELDRRIAALREAETAARAAGDERRAELCAEKLSRLEDEGLRTLDDLFRDAREGVYTPLPASTPSALVAIVAKATAPRTADRYVNARSLAADLEAWLAGSPTRAAAERGSSAAAVVQGAGRAIRRHLTTAVLVAAAAALGVALGPSLGLGARPVREAPAADARTPVGVLEARVDALAKQGSRLSPREAATTFDVLSEAVESARAAARGDDAARLAEVAARVSAPHVVVRVAGAAAPAAFEDRFRGRTIEAKDGDAALAPGEYTVVVGSGSKVRLPLRVPFVVRDRGDSGERAAPVATVDVPIAPDAIPAGMALVVPPTGGVEFRGPPFAVTTAIPATVAPFLMDREETTNRDYQAFLESVGDGERKRRVPATGFVPDAARANRFRVGQGLEDVPVVGVSPDDALAYAAWRKTRDRAAVRLPTEAEWCAAAGVAFGWTLPSGWEQEPRDGDFAPPLKPSSKVPERLEPFGILALVGNAREIVSAVRAPMTAEYLAKGAAPGDDPIEAAIRRVRPVAHDAKDPKNGFRCVREISEPPKEPAK